MISRTTLGAVLLTLSSLSHASDDTFSSLRPDLAQAFNERSCLDDLGKEVAFISLNKDSPLWEVEPRIAEAKLNATKEPVVYYNFSLFNRLSVNQALFIKEHECAHHSEGHVNAAANRDKHDFLSFSGKRDAEYEADCVATLRLRDHYGFKASQFKEVFSFLDHKQAAATHPDNARRLEEIMFCYHNL
jgi:hypothetical protein